MESSLDFSYQIYWSCKQVPTEWDEMNLPYDIFLSIPYMQALESNAPEGMDFVYVLFKKNERAVGKAYFKSNILMLLKIF